MERHILTGVEAVIDSATNHATSSVIWVDESDVCEALYQIQKLADGTPETRAFTFGEREEVEEYHRVAIEVE